MKRTRLLIAALGLFLIIMPAYADWTAAKRLTWNSGYSAWPAIAMDSSNIIHVVWSDNTPGNREIYYKRSSDGGTTWSGAKSLTWTSGDSYEPAIAIDTESHIHVVWFDDTTGITEIYYKKSTDKGTTWTTAKRLTWTSNWSCGPALAIDANNIIHVVWNVETPAGFSEIYYKRSTDGGTTWNAAERLTWISGLAQTKAMAIDSGNALHLVWQNWIYHSFLPDNYEIYYKRSTDGGTTWNTAQRLTMPSGFAMSPAPAIDSSDVIHVVWYDKIAGNYEIYYRRSTDRGTTWSAVKRLTWTAGYSSCPVMGIDSNDAIHAFWSDYTPGNFEIYYKKSIDGGMSWSAGQRKTWTSGGSYVPAIAIDSSDIIHVVWFDETPGNFEIYYMNGK